MRDENISFFESAVKIENNQNLLFCNPFVLNQRDHLLLKDPLQQEPLRRRIELCTVPFFIINCQPRRKDFCRNPGGAEDDRDILWLALNICNILMQIEKGTAGQRFYWFSCERTRRLTERLNQKEMVSSLLNGSLYITPLQSLSELLTSSGAPMKLYEYIQRKHGQWRAASENVFA